MSPVPLREPSDGGGRLVRPYAITAGRTRPCVEDLPIEAMVLATPEGQARASGLTREERAIIQRCATALSIAEIAAHTDVPLGVARVLVADLLSDGLVAVSGFHATGAATGGGERAPSPRHDLDLLERVLHGLRSL